MSYLMWEFKNVNVGRFHEAATKAQRTEMIGKGYVDTTNMNGLELPYPTGYKGPVVTPSPKTKTKAAV